MDYLILGLDSNQCRYSSSINISIEKKKTATATNTKENLTEIKKVLGAEYQRAT